jgi:hypothetical protein
MGFRPCEDPVTTAGWSDLIDELDRWGQSASVATLWWRDDDAVTVTSRLDRLVSIAGDVPISLAVIPAAADQGLAEWVIHGSQSRQAMHLAVLQHGWRHTNHALDGKKNEFPPERSYCAVRSELTGGRKRLAALCGAHWLPVLVPPWNRFAPRFLPLLSLCGFRAISRVKPRHMPWAVRGVAEANVHIDLVGWAAGGGFIGVRAALGGIVGHLQARRLGRVDAREPTGILTHHLVQDPAADAFLRRLIVTTTSHPATRWLDAREVFWGGICSER